MATKDFYQVGGSLRKNLPSYVERQADIDLYEGLQKREFCYVLAARQMGKSSLSVRMMKRLMAEGWAMAYVDLTAFGTTGFNAEQWYFSFLEEVAYMLDVTTDLQTWWDAHRSITPVNRMSKFWEAVVLEEISSPIAIFIDEIDAMLGIDEGIFRTNDFFSSIRAAYNKRSTDSKFNRLNFSIFGVATPQDLMNRKNGTPFNIGKEIQVLHFTETEAAGLKNGLANKEATNQAMLHRILHWTGGQPFLTQTLCQKLSAQSCELAEVNKVVDEVVKAEFLRKDILSAPHFSNIENRINHNGNYNLRMLDLYRQVLEKEIHEVDQRGVELHYLKLSGLVQEKEAGIQASNYLYTQVFNSDWLKEAYSTIDRPITMALNIWIKSGYGKDALLTGKLLKEVEEWASGRTDLTTEEQNLIKASRKQKDRGRLIKTGAWLGFLVLLASSAVVYFFQQNQINSSLAALEKERADAEAKEKQAKENQNTRLQFDGLLAEAEGFLRMEACPKPVLKKMDSLSINHPDRTIMLRKIQEIENNQLCQ